MQMNRCVGLVVWDSIQLENSPKYPLRILPAAIFHLLVHFLLYSFFVFQECPRQQALEQELRRLLKLRPLLRTLSSSNKGLC